MCFDSVSILYLERTKSSQNVLRKGRSQPTALASRRPAGIVGAREYLDGTVAAGDDTSVFTGAFMVREKYPAGGRFRSQLIIPGSEKCPAFSARFLASFWELVDPERVSASI